MRLTPSSFRAALIGALSAVSCNQTDPSPLGDGCTDPLLVQSGLYRCAEGYLHREAATTCVSEVPRSEIIEFPAGTVVPVAGASGAAGTAGVAGSGGTAGIGGTAGTAGNFSAGGAAGTAGGPASIGDYTISADECSRDSDCTGVREYCALFQTNSSYACMVPAETPDYARRCIQGCVADADCGPTQICACGSPMGQCETVSAIAGCKSDADCAGGALCLQNARTDNYAPLTFACQLPGDRCRTDQDCMQSSYGFCSMSAIGRTCAGAYICGRPFLVAGQARVAGTRRNGSWTERSLGRLERPEDPSLIRRLVDHWTEIALMEHASVAAFARFTLQLMALGAPAELIEDATRAQADEIRHARTAFDLARHYGARPVAPGPLDLCGLSVDASLEDFVTTTIHEGCVGETMAALEIAHSAQHATDDELRALLETIADDEARHSALAWKAVRWLLERNPELHAVCEREFARAAESVRPPAASKEESTAAEYGVTSAATRTEIGMQALSDVIVPCARALLCSAHGVALVTEGRVKTAPHPVVNGEPAYEAHLQANYEDA